MCGIWTQTRSVNQRFILRIKGVGCFPQNMWLFFSPDLTHHHPITSITSHATQKKISHAKSQGFSMDFRYKRVIPRICPLPTWFTSHESQGSGWCLGLCWLQGVYLFESSFVFFCKELLVSERFQTPEECRGPQAQSFNLPGAKSQDQRGCTLKTNPSNHMNCAEYFPQHPFTIK